MYPDVHCSITYNRQDTEATQVPTDGQRKCDLQSGLLFSDSKECNLAIGDNTGGPIVNKPDKDKDNKISLICGI